MVGFGWPSCSPESQPGAVATWGNPDTGWAGAMPSQVRARSDRPDDDLVTSSEHPEAPGTGIHVGTTRVCLQGCQLLPGVPQSTPCPLSLPGLLLHPVGSSPEPFSRDEPTCQTAHYTQHPCRAGPGLQPSIPRRGLLPRRVPGACAHLPGPGVPPSSGQPHGHC